MSRSALSVACRCLWLGCLLIGTFAAGDERATTPVAAVLPPVSEADVRQTLEAAARKMDEGPPRGTALDFFRRNANYQRIDDAFDKQVDLEFIDTELSQVFSFLSERYQIPIIPDTTRLTDFGVGLDTPVNLVISGVSLRSALELILDPLELDYVIQQEVLHVTTREYADQVMEVRLYELRRLPREYPADDLARVIQHAVRPGSWHVEPKVIPPGTVVQYVHPLPMEHRLREKPANVEAPTVPQTSPLPDATDLMGASIQALPGCLVIRQTQRGHREVAELLGQFELMASNPAALLPTDGTSGLP